MKFRSPRLLLAVLFWINAFVALHAQSGFVPYVRSLDLAGNIMPDTEYDPIGNQCTWRDPDGLLWSCQIDPQTGKFDFTNKVNLDSSLAPITGEVAVGNGPEWSFSRGNSSILYTSQIGDPAPENWRIKVATKDSSGIWSTQYVSTVASETGSTPEGTRDATDTDPLLAYYFVDANGIRQVAWQSFRNPGFSGVLPFIATSPFQWGDDSHLMVTATIIKGLSQVVLFDPNSPKTYSQVSTSTNVIPNRVAMWSAPEFGNNTVISSEQCPLNQSNTVLQVGLFRVVNNKWKQYASIQSPSTTGYNMIQCAKHVVYNNTSYLYMAMTGTDVPGSEIWMCNIKPPITFWRIAGFDQGVASIDPEAVVTGDGVYLYLNQQGGSRCLQAWTGLSGSLTDAPFQMALLPKATFKMGDRFSEGASDETPVHTVTVNSSYIDRYAISSAVWKKVTNWANQNGYALSDHSQAEGDFPVEVTWYEAALFCNARSEMESRIPAYYTDAQQTVVYRTGEVDLQNLNTRWTSGYRLPTEAEWECAARGGQTRTRFSLGNMIDENAANYDATLAFPYDKASAPGYNPLYQSISQPYFAPVFSFSPNGYGLYNTTGNLAQWCWDWHGNYSLAKSSDPHGPAQADFITSWRVIRGGGWSSNAFDCRVARRLSSTPTTTAGFRTVLPLGP